MAAIVAVLFALAPGIVAPSEESARPPEIELRRVSAARLESWFPDRADLTRLSADQRRRIERSRTRLNDAAGSTQGGRVIDREASRPLRIQHEARWIDGRLVGRTRLVFAPASPKVGTRWTALDPWSPAIDAVQPAAVEPAHPNGRRTVLLKLRDPTTTEAEILWRQRGRPGSNGRVFYLDLPAFASTSLIIDLPEAWEPVGPPGYREGPLESETPGHQRWRFDGPGGSIALRLQRTAEATRLGPSAEAWVGGETSVTVTEAGARWETEWTVEPGSEGWRPLGVTLQPGMTWFDVDGPDVDRVEERRDVTGRARLLVKWRDGVGRSTRLRLEGAAELEPKRDWPVPSPRPINAFWLGGAVRVRLDPSWSLADVRERHGRAIETDSSRSAEQAGAAGAPLTLAFHQDRPGPVASLELTRRHSNVAVGVRGEVRFPPDEPPSLRANLLIDDGLIGRSRPLVVALSPGWWPQDVRIPGSESIDWSAEPAPDGSILLTLWVPEASEAGLSVLLVTAESTRGRRQSFDLPRIQPRDAPVMDERWVVLAPPDQSPRPLEARGIAWLDPEAEAATSDEETLRPSLAWRWIDPEAEARVAWQRVRPVGRARIDQRIVLNAGHLTSHWRVELEVPDDRLPQLHLALDPPPPSGSTLQWSRIQDGEAVPYQPEVSESGHVRLPRTAGRPLTLEARLETQWEGSGAPPKLLIIGEGVETRGTRALFVDPSLHCEAAADLSYVEFDPETARRSGAIEPIDQAGQPKRLAFLFAHEGRPGSLVIRSRRLSPGPHRGVIRRATLNSRPRSGSPTLQRLDLEVVAPGSSNLDVRLPSGAQLVVATVEDRVRDPILHRGRLRFPIPHPPPIGRPLHIQLQYTTEAGTIGGGFDAVPTAERPIFSMPCQSFVWRIDPPASWTLRQAGPNLTVTDRPADSAPLIQRLPGLPLRPEPRQTWRRFADSIAELGADRSAPVRTLEDLIALWDAGEIPIVVDTVGLEAARLGPSTPLPQGTAVDDPEALEPLGLRMDPVESMILVSDRKGAFAAEPTGVPGSSAALPRPKSLIEAVVWGADRTDRYRTVDRWRGTSATAKRPSEQASTAIDSAWTLASAGWPSHGASVVLVRTWPWRVAGWTLGVLLLFATVPLGRVHPRRVAIAVLLCGGASLGLGVWGGPRLRLVSQGPAIAAMVWVGGAIAVRITRPRARGGSRREGEPGSVVPPQGSSYRSSSVSVGLMLILLVLGAARPRPQEPTPIPVFQVFDEEDSVWVRTSDLERLVEALDAGSDPGPAAEPEGTFSEVTVADVRHTLRSLDDRTWLLESRLTIRLERAGAASWSVPVGRSLGIEAAFDGASNVGVLVRPDARRAVVPIQGRAGLHELIVRRRVPIQAEGDLRSLSVPIDPVASSRLTIEGVDQLRPWVPPTVSGEPTLEDDGSWSAALGPIDRIELRWGDATLADEASIAAVEALMLWRALPASDQLTLRLTLRSDAPLRRLRLNGEAGMRLKSSSMTNAIVDATRDGPPEKPRWTLRFDPPLNEDATLELEFWRELEPPPSNTVHARRPPRVVIEGAERVSGQLALLRPRGWRGYLEPIPGTAPLSDQEFEAAWGGFSYEGELDPAGATRFQETPTPTLRLGPTASRRVATNSIQLELSAGRWSWQQSSRIEDRDGLPIRRLALRVPERLRVHAIHATDLTYWDRPEPDRLRLRFDQQPSARHTILVLGSLTIPSSPLEPGPIEASIAIPWTSWDGVDQEPADLTITAPEAATIDLDGLEPSEVERDDAPASQSNRVVRRWRSLEAALPLKASLPQPLGLSVEHRFLVGRHSVTWTVRLDGAIPRGPVEAITLEIPEAWSRSTTASIPGQGPLRTQQIGDKLTLVFEELQWDRLQLELSAARRLEAGGTITAPSIRSVPGTRIDTERIAIVNATGNPIGVKSVGLEEIQGTAAIDSFRLWTAIPGARAVAHRVVEPASGWSMTLNPQANETAGERSSDRPGVLDWEAVCVLDRAGVERGVMFVRLSDRPGPFLEIPAPEGRSLVSATIDGRPARPLERDDGLWLVPLGDEEPRRVTLSWIGHDPNPGSGTDGNTRRIELPRPRGGARPSLLTIHTPVDVQFNIQQGPAMPISASAFQIEQLERLVDRLGRAIRAEAEGLPSLLSRFRTRLRTAERAIRWSSGPEREVVESIRKQSAYRQVDMARQRVEVELEAAGRAALLDEPERPPAAPVFESLSVPRLGVPHFYRVEPNAETPIIFEWTPQGWQ